VLLLVHGIPLVVLLAQHDPGHAGPIRVIAVDHIGCGLSEKPAVKDYSYRLAQRIADLNELIEKLDLRAGHACGSRLGRGHRHGRGRGGPRPVRPIRADEHRRVPNAEMPLGHSSLPYPMVWPVAVQGLNLFVRAALRTTVCKHERMTPAVKAGYSAPYDSWRHRVAVLRFVLDIPLNPSHPSYQTLTNIENGLAQFVGHPICLIWGIARLVLYAPVSRPISLTSFPARCIAWLTRAIM